MKTYALAALTLVPAFVLTGCADTNAGVKALCEQTVQDYATYRDQGPVASYTGLFTSDGTFELGDTVTRGHDALAARHVAANSAAKWRHDMGTIKISVTEESITGVSRVMVRTCPHDQEPVTTREILADYNDEFIIQAGQCRIKSRKVKVIAERIVPDCIIDD